MILIQKNTAPNSLTEYRQTPNASFDDMDSAVKADLRESLLNEQGHLCAYCMSRINANTKVKIEHFSARTPENELQYQNLFAVCGGNEGQKYSLQTCDTRKGNRKLHINPLNPIDMSTIKYNNDGTIHSTDPVYESELHSVLNLNCPNGYLIANRKTAIQTIRNELSKLRPGQDRKVLLEKLWKAYSEPKIELEPYVGIIRWYINKQLRKYVS